MNATTKDQALTFLKELESTLNNKLPGPAGMKSWIRDKVATAKKNDQQKCFRSPEAAFLNGQALRVLSDVLTSCGLSSGEARQALLSEYHRGIPDIAQASAIRWEPHPFQKTISSTPGKIYRGWTDPKKSHALMRSCPDFALRDPFPHSILFEGKYFPSGSLEFAQRQLVTSTYEAFFYRGLPRLEANKRHPLEWGYDYACLMAYDASSAGTLMSAWTAIHRNTRCSFWEGANLYVMILRPRDSPDTTSAQPS